MSKLVSIILPTYNGSKYIRKSIESVISQTYLNWELLVINDGSVDETENIINEYLEKDKRIIYIKNEFNLGIQKALNYGLKEAKGEYIARIDDDDQWIDKDKLVKQINFLENNLDYVLVGTGAIVVNENDEELFRYLLPEKDGEIRRKILSKNCFVHSSVMFRKKSAVILGGYSDKLETKHIEDYDLWLRLGLIGSFANIDSYINFTARKSSLTSGAREIQASHVLRILPKYKKKYPYFYYGYIVSYTRLLFFKIISNTWINNKIMYKIQSFYKNI